jgi:2-methylcitrate dehydratase
MGPEMPTVIERMGRYATELNWEDFPHEVIGYAKRILLDSLACAYGGLDSEPARLVRETLSELTESSQATVFGRNVKTGVSAAALANGVAIRYQDYNDVYFGPAWTAHPSDMLAALCAVAEWRDRSGKDLLTAMIAAYEVQLRFSDLPVRKNLWHAGWHHTVACSYAAAAGVGRLLGLTADRMANAIALAGARSNTLAEIRHGDIPMDKALSAPIVASQAILYSLLAARGFTGCMTLLEGPYGFGKSVAGGVDVEPLVPRAGDYRIMKMGLKPYPVEGMTPAMVQAALELRAEHRLAPQEVQAIRILAHEEALTKPSWDERKLAPTTKETADHSFYYCVAVALTAGEVTPRQFDADWLQNRQVSELMAKTTMEEKKELTALYQQGARPAGVEVRTARGTFYREVQYPLGDPRNPMTVADVTRKFLAQAAPVVGEGRARELVDRLLAVEREPTIRPLMERLGCAVGRA